MEYLLEDFLPTLIDLSIMGSFTIVFVLVIRLLLKNTPKIYSYILWIVVLFRLLSPFSVESNVGIIPNQTQTALVSDVILESTAFELPYDTEVYPEIDKSVIAAVIVPTSFIVICIWFFGVTIIFFYSIITLVKTKKNLVGCVPLEENIFIADHIKTPFVLGLVKPKIYLPSSINEKEIEFILMHEKIHIKRLDYITRIIAFIALSMHWFNPLVWMAYILSAKDMEMSCDEAVMNKMGDSIKKDYSSSLLHFEVGKYLISPLAFSEGDVKERVKNIMKYKKTKLGVSVFCVVLIGSLVFVLMGTQKQKLDYNTELGDIYKEIQNNDTLSKPIQIFYNTKVGDEQYIGILAGDDIVLSTAKNVNGEWIYQGDHIFSGANDKKSVVVCRKVTELSGYDIVLSSNPNIKDITKTLANGDEVRVDAVYSGKFSMTLISVNPDNDYVEMKYNDNTVSINVQSEVFENNYIKAMITEIDRENNTFKVSLLDNHEILNENITLDVENTTFFKGDKESLISDFSVGYLVEMHVNITNVVNNILQPFMIKMNDSTSFDVITQ